MIQEACFQSAEAVVVPLDAWFRKTDGLWVALFGQFVDDGAARIGQFHHLAALVESLAGSVVDGGAHHFHIKRAAHNHKL